MLSVSQHSVTGVKSVEILDSSVNAMLTVLTQAQLTKRLLCLLSLLLKACAKSPTQTKTHNGDQVASYENSKHNLWQSSVIVLHAITFFSTSAKIRGGLSQDQGNANNNATELY